MEEEEVWKPVRNYEGLYEVSNMGRVKSLNYNKTGKERIMKLNKDKDGYLLVNLHKNAKMECCKVHRLVATAFLDNSNNLPEVNHKDENKLNNCVDNLEWCSRSYNMTYNGRAKKVGKKLRGRKQTEEHNKKRAEKRKKPIFSINKESGLIIWWKSAKEAGKILGIDSSSITKCCKGKYNSAGGHIWFYAD